jgi:hypothetical protein
MGQNRFLARLTERPSYLSMDCVIARAQLPIEALLRFDAHRFAEGYWEEHSRGVSLWLAYWFSRKAAVTNRWVVEQATQILSSSQRVHR